MKTLILSSFASLIILSGAAQTTTLNFDDLAQDTFLTGKTYGGIFWEQGNAGFRGNIGGWKAGNAMSNYPHSGTRNVINYWGSTLTGMSFSSVVNVQSAYFAAQGSPTNWTSGVRVHGYLDGAEIATTGWFNQIGTNPVLFNINLSGVDRIVIESIPVDLGGGWFGMDDFTYSVVPEPTTAALLIIGIAGATLWGRRYSHAAGSTH
jgi:hypothetical protein